MVSPHAPCTANPTKQTKPETNERKQTMNTESKNDEARFEGVNWDEDWKPKVQMHAHGDQQPVRKVLTKGVREVYCDEFVLIKKLLRQGYEVQLREPGAKDSFLRVYPLLGTDLKTMYARAQAMLPLSTCIADKKVKMVFRGKEYTKPEDASAAIDETRYRRENGEYDGEEDGEKLPSVTPDTVVKCPKCGTRFRVGRALANDAA